jgi:SAM-dependent methyltransferase
MDARRRIDLLVRFNDSTRREANELRAVSQYQSFPGAAGDSQSLQKLKALHLPPLKARSFLDVGCNEGFFCGYARFDGAGRVVGIDKSAVFINRARQRFPDCEFLRQGWDRLPKGPFDVILLASSLHYAEDQAQLIASLMKELSAEGTLVLELGVHTKPGSEWVNVKRGIDERLFPTWAKLEEVLRPYAWKHIGPSVQQPGDSIGRQVIHIRPRKPVAYLLMEPPGFGKSSICRAVFQRAGMKVVSGDTIIARIAEGRLEAPAEMTGLVKQQFAPLRIDQVILSLARARLLNDLVRLWLREAGGQDFALDAFIPEDFHEEVSRLLSGEGYMTVKLTWQRVGEGLPPNDVLARQADAYFASLGNQNEPVGAVHSAQKLPFEGTTGIVEHVVFDNGRLTIKGWALHESGQMPEFLQLKIGDRSIDIRTFTKHVRPDVQKHFGLEHAMCGYVVTAALEPDEREDLQQMQMFGGNEPSSLSGPFRKSRQLTESR